MTRGDFLEEAQRIVEGRREDEYGPVEDNFEVIARLWEAYKGIPFSPVDVAVMMILLKTARIRGGGTHDCFVDIAGYAACGGEIWAKRREKNDGGLDGNQPG